MKSNKVMKRKMGSYEVMQRTSDSYFNASSILSQWNSRGNSERRINKYLSMSKTKDFIHEIEMNLQMANMPNADFKAVKVKKGGYTHNGRIADEEWEDESIRKYFIVRTGNQISSGYGPIFYYFLAFHTREQRDYFMKYNERLVKDYLMLD